MPRVDIDFSRIQARGGSRRDAFEDFVTQLARGFNESDVGLRFQKNGPGADLGVECLWHLADETKWGWQAKYVWKVESLTSQAWTSFTTAIAQHPRLTRYYICFPFTPSASKGNGEGKSQVEKIESFRKKCMAHAKQLDSAVEVFFWGASELEDYLLQIDPNGGRRSYWFDDLYFSESWVESQVRLARSQAGARYSPEIHTGNAPVLASVFAALGSSSQWMREVEQKVRAIQRVDSLLKQFRSKQRSEVQRRLVPIVDELATTLWHVRRCSSIQETVAVLRACFLALDLPGLNELYSFIRASLPLQNENNGVADKDSEDLDKLRDILGELNDLRAWSRKPAARFVSERTLLITGEAGAGKTHTLVRIAESRLSQGLPTVIVFGHLFTAPTAWESIRSQVGIGSNWGREAFFDALDAAGASAGQPLLLCVDAINETEQRGFWQTELAGLVSAVSARTNLALCVSCRSGFEQTSGVAEHQMTSIDHPGLVGSEFQSRVNFFRYYGLEPDTSISLHPGFSNPLYLKLTCEALVDEGHTRIPTGWKGILSIIRSRLDNIDTKLNEFNDEYVGKAATKAVSLIARAMVDRKTRLLSLEDCLSVINDGDKTLARRTISILFREHFLDKQEVFQHPDALESRGPLVRFSYEALGDHLIAKYILDDTKDPSLLPKTFSHSSFGLGVLIALSIQLPSAMGVELTDLPCEEADLYLAQTAWVRGLQWRDPSQITERTKHHIERLLQMEEFAGAAFDALVAIILRPNHSCDIRWIHTKLESQAMPERDAWWATALHFSYVRDGGVKKVLSICREKALIDRIDDDTATMLCTVLCWFCASSDRRVRDLATKAAVAILSAHPRSAKVLLQLFCAIDDDYILERVLVAVYGALLICRDSSIVLPLRRHLSGIVLHTTHAVVRDTCRLVSELAVDLGAPEEVVDLALFYPKKEGEWPIVIPSEDEIHRRHQPDEHRSLSILRSSVLGDYVADFQTYTMPRILGIFKESIDVRGLAARIFRDVIALGFDPALHGAYDEVLSNIYGGGRGRERWAERIGKKYQWISLSRLQGLIAAYLIPKAKYEKFSGRYLPGFRLRDIDPTFLNRERDDAEFSSLWSEFRYDPDTAHSEDPEGWLQDAEEFQHTANRFIDMTYNGDANWLCLDSHKSWYGERPGEGALDVGRNVWIQLRSFLVPQDSFSEVYEWSARQSFFGRWMPAPTEIHGAIYLGEYPWGASVLEESLFDHWLGWEDRRGCPANLRPTTLSMERSFSSDCSADGLGENVGFDGALLPTPELLSGYRWDGKRGFVNATGELHFADPSLEFGGLSACMADRTNLISFLERNELSLLWTVLGEKVPADMTVDKRHSFSFVKGLHNGEFVCPSTPVVEVG